MVGELENNSNPRKSQKVEIQDSNRVSFDE